ncbi:MAG: hypothetical protein KAJ55_16280 [Anaerolineales bacterium]|nr:hypothetical protein [Anaerolineales bacterium]
MPKEVDKEQEFVTRVSGLIQYYEDCLEDFKYIKVLWKDAEKLIKLGGQTNIKAGKYAKRKLLSIDIEGDEDVWGADLGLIEDNMKEIKDGKPIEED